jgi:hypothetical protein
VLIWWSFIPNSFIIPMQDRYIFNCTLLWYTPLLQVNQAIISLVVLDKERSWVSIAWTIRALAAAWRRCIIFNALYSLHCILCIVFNALYYMLCILCIVLYALYSLHCMLCIVFYALYAMHCALYSMHCILCIVIKLETAWFTSTRGVYLQLVVFWEI